MSTTPQLEKLAYSLEEFAEVVSLSYAQLMRHIARDELVPKYSCLLYTSDAATTPYV